MSEHYTHPDPAVRELIARHVAAALEDVALEDVAVAIEHGCVHGVTCHCEIQRRARDAARIVRNLTPP